MSRKVKLPPVDEAKLLICEMDERDIDSVIAYARYWVGQLRRKRKFDEKRKEQS